MPALEAQPATPTPVPATFVRKGCSFEQGHPGSQRRQMRGGTCECRRRFRWERQRFPEAGWEGRSCFLRRPRSRSAIPADFRVKRPAPAASEPVLHRRNQPSDPACVTTGSRAEPITKGRGRGRPRPFPFRAKCAALYRCGVRVTGWRGGRTRTGWRRPECARRR